MTHTFAELFKGFRLRKSLTQKELAESIGVTKGYIAALEQGVRRKPTQSVLEKMGAILDLSEQEYQNLLLVAQGIDIPFSPGKAASSPLFEALEQLLAAPPNSPMKAKRLDTFYKCLSAAIVDQGTTAQAKKETQLWALRTRGYAYTPAEKLQKHPSYSVEQLSRHLKDKTEMGVAIRGLLDIFLDAKVPCQKRTALAKELLSLAEWRCHAKTEVGNQNKDSEKP